MAVGRRPRVEGLGLAEIGVEFDATGWVRVDESLSDNGSWGIRGR